MDDMNQQQGSDGNGYRNMSVASNNNGFNSASALQIRLDTTIVDEFEKYLRGVDKRWTTDEKGRMKEVVVWQGKQMVNEEGYQAVMQWLNIAINKASMMGNFVTEEDYGNYMCNIHKDFTEDLIINRTKYGIKIDNLTGLIHKFTDVSCLILTRALFDKERSGMNNTTRIQETMQSHQQGGGFFNMPLFGGKK